MASSSSQEDSPTKSDKGSVREVEDLDATKVTTDEGNVVVTDVRYRLYKRRFAGLVGFVSWLCFLVETHVEVLTEATPLQVILAAVSAMGWPWFGPISNNSTPLIGYSQVHS